MLDAADSTDPTATALRILYGCHVIVLSTLAWRTATSVKNLRYGMPQYRLRKYCEAQIV